MEKIVLIGAPNVGKSSIFNILTDSYVTVSNYPGTTIDISRGVMQALNKKYEIIDTPGTYSLSPLTDEEAVTRDMLLTEQPDIVVHVVDAKNMKRMLAMTLELIETGLNVILVLNMMDEAIKLGMSFDVQSISLELGIPVITTSVRTKVGLERLKLLLTAGCRYNKQNKIRYSKDIEECIIAVMPFVAEKYLFNKRYSAISLIKQDEYAIKILLTQHQQEAFSRTIGELENKYNINPAYLLIEEYRRISQDLSDRTVNKSDGHLGKFAENIAKWSREPWPGIPILICVLYFGLYQFVGIFGAGYLVDYLDKQIFFPYINTIVQSLVKFYNLPDIIQRLIVGNYGVFSMGFRYATVIILPIVTTFFLMFSLLEDCGYLPRLAMLSNKIFSWLGLNGRFMIPLTLGFGCGTMAIMVTRTLESPRERILATFLIALCVPCSAQLGLVISLLSFSYIALLLWIFIIVLVFFITGWLVSKIIPGQNSYFYMELPPMRLPQVTNVIKKTYSRVIWYLCEIIPVFIITSILLWVADEVGLLKKIIVLLTPVMESLGLPPESASAFMMGFFRRDYGTAGLYDMFAAKVLSSHQLLVAAVTLTLFVPCVAQMTVMIKERGVLTASIIFITIIIIAFMSGLAVHNLLKVFPVIN